MGQREQTLSEILRLVWEQTEAMKTPVTSVQAVEKRAARIDKLVRRIADDTKRGSRRSHWH